jgi:hypothetical protein
VKGGFEGEWEKAELREKKLTESILAKENKNILEKAPKEADDRKKYLQSLLSKEEGRGIMKNLNRIAAIMGLILKEGKITRLEEKSLLSAIKGGLNPDKITEKRPDLAPIVGKTIEEVIKKIKPEDFHKKVQAESYDNIDVVFRVLLDKSNIDELSKSAGASVKKKIIDTIRAHGAGYTMTPAEQRTIRQRMADIASDPRWPV